MLKNNLKNFKLTFIIIVALLLFTSLSFSCVSEAQYYHLVGVTATPWSNLTLKLTNYNVTFTSAVGINATTDYILIWFPPQFTIDSTVVSTSNLLPEGTGNLTLMSVTTTADGWYVLVLKPDTDIGKFVPCKIIVYNVQNPATPDYYYLKVSTQTSTTPGVGGKEGPTASSAFQIVPPSYTKAIASNIKVRLLELTNAFLQGISPTTARIVGKLISDIIELSYSVIQTLAG